MVAGAAVTVVLAAENYQEGHAPATSSREPRAGIRHAGTARDADGNIVSAGGRVLAVVGTGSDLQAAREEAYGRLAEIKLAGGHFRDDIGLAALEAASL